MMIVSSYFAILTHSASLSRPRLRIQPRPFPSTYLSHILQSRSHAIFELDRPQDVSNSDALHGENLGEHSVYDDKSPSWTYWKCNKILGHINIDFHVAKRVACKPQISASLAVPSNKRDQVDRSGTDRKNPPLEI